MPDLSQVIQQGTERSGRLGQTLSAQAGQLQDISSKQTMSVMQVKAQQIQAQGRIDQMANSYSTVARQLIQRKNAASSAHQKAVAAGDNKSADRALAELEIATGNLSNYVLDLSQDPRAMANLKSSSIGAKNITEDFFNEENLKGATEEEREVLAQRLASLAAMSQPAGEKSLERIQGEAYARQRGANLASAEVAQPATQVGSVISMNSFVTKMRGQKVGEDLAKSWHANYFDPLSRDIKAVTKMPAGEKEFFSDIFSQWSGLDVDKGDVVDFKATLERPDDLSEAGNNLYDLMNRAVSENDPRLLGEFINQAKGMIRAPTAPQLRARTPGAEAGGV